MYSEAYLFLKKKSIFFLGGGSLVFLSERPNTAKKLFAMQLHIVDFKVDNSQ